MILPPLVRPPPRFLGSCPSLRKLEINGVLLTIAELLVRDLFALKVVPGHDLVDLILSVFSELVVADLDLDDVGVALERVFQRGCVRFFDLVAGDVQFLDRFVQFEVLGE